MPTRKERKNQKPLLEQMVEEFPEVLKGLEEEEITVNSLLKEAKAKLSEKDYRKIEAWFLVGQQPEGFSEILSALWGGNKKSKLTAIAAVAGFAGGGAFALEGISRMAGWERTRLVTRFAEKWLG